MNSMPDEAEREQRDGVAVPALLALGIDAAEAVGEPLNRPHDRIEPGAPARDRAPGRGRARAAW